MLGCEADPFSPTSTKVFAQFGVLVCKLVSQSGSVRWVDYFFPCVRVSSEEILAMVCVPYRVSEPPRHPAGLFSMFYPI